MGRHQARHRATKQRWVKLHALFGNLSNVVVAAKVTTNNSGDAPELLDLLAQASEAFTIAELSADKAYVSY